MKNKNKIVFNTSILYVRLIIGLIIGFYITRLVLDAIGEVNFGIYSLVAGVIGMLAFLNSSMSGVSMRFIAISLGKNDILETNKIFNSILLIHILLGFTISIFMTIAGLFIFDGFLNIPNDKVYEATIIYYLMVLSTFVTMISVPYDAKISAHEDFTPLSIIELLNTFLSLAIAILISNLQNNLLITYGVLMCANLIIIRVIKQLYCRKRYNTLEINLRKYVDMANIKEIVSFTGWKTLDSSAAVLYVQVQGILINIFFGVTLNAANGVSRTLSSKLNIFATRMLNAVNPQIIKNEGTGNREKMLQLTATSAKFSVFLFSIFAIPMFIEMPYILNIWLKNVPDYTLVFCRLLIIQLLIKKFSFSINTAMSAVGKVKGITVVVLIDRFFQFIIVYYFLKLGYPPYSIFIIGIIFAIIGTFYKLYFGQKIAKLNIRDYIKVVIIQGILPIIFTVLLTLIPIYLLEESFNRLILTMTVSIISFILFIRIFGLTTTEYAHIKIIWISIKRKLSVYAIKAGLA